MADQISHFKNMWAMYGILYLNTKFGINIKFNCASISIRVENPAT